jgi:hypothetical protein
MTPTALESLQKIGKQLDSNVYPVVHNGGIVMPCDTTAPKPKGEEKSNERQRSKRSETKPWEGTTGRQGTTSETSSLISTELQTLYESELSEVYKAYPKTQAWIQPNGILLLTESALLYNINQPALFLVAIPYAVNLVVNGWGFWGTTNVGIEWIGPRHTNFPDGSICAFEPTDGTWYLGDSLIQLLDLYSVWALRHLHLKITGRWPGYQAIQFPYERILELRSDEYCGCRHSDKLYGECCQKSDIYRNTITDAVNFSLNCYSGYRKPPLIVTDFVLRRTAPPNITDLVKR